MATDTPAVRMHGIRKSFGTNPVLRGVNFELATGEVHALLGGNGAGKSTLMKILQGVHRPDAGTISINGREAHIATPADATAAGIGMVFQEFSLIPSLSVGRNVFLGREPRRLGLIDDSEINRRTRELLAMMGSAVDPQALVGELSVGHWQVTEIAKALSADASILVMDEPTASLPYSEVDALFGLIDRLKQRGISIIYISHRMAEIARVADRLTVLRDGTHATPFLDPGIDVREGARDGCEGWPAQPTLRIPYADNVKGLPATLVVSTTGDASPPYEGGKRLAEALGGMMLTAEGEQHTVVMAGTNPCVDAIVSDYLVDLELPPADASCVL